MAIEKYTTKCLVLGYFDQGESDRVYKIFTREFGLVMVHAKSIRKLESKMRAHVMPHAFSLVTLVKGKEVWRLVGAEEQKESSDVHYEVSELVTRFIHGEEPHKELFDRIEEFVEKSVIYDKKNYRILFYYILLVELGYADSMIVGAKNIKEFKKWSVEDLYTHLLLSMDDVVEHTRRVLKEMQL